AELGASPPASWPSGWQGRCGPQAPRDGSGQTVLQHPLEELVSSSRHPSAIWCCRQAGQHCCARTLLANAEGKLKGRDGCAATAPGISPRSPFRYFLVQRQPATHDAAGSYARRSLLREASSLPPTSLRTATGVATGSTLRQSASARQRPTGRRAGAVS